MSTNVEKMAQAIADLNAASSAEAAINAAQTVAVDKIAAKLQALLDGAAANALSDAAVADLTAAVATATAVKDSLASQQARLDALAADAGNPVPTPTPDPTPIGGDAV